MQAGKIKQDMRMAELLHCGEGLKGVYENMVTVSCGCCGCLTNVNERSSLETKTRAHVVVCTWLF